MIRLIPLLLLSVPLHVFACSCIARPVEAKVRGADAIYIARAIDIRHVDVPPAGHGARHPVAATFRVHRHIKGVDTPHVVLQTGRGGGDCGVPLTEGSDYLLLVDAGNELSLCSGSRPLHDAEVETLTDQLKAIVAAQASEPNN